LRLLHPDRDRARISQLPEPKQWAVLDVIEALLARQSR
jgi:hypothetical protein